MLKTLKKMILRTKDDSDLDKPIERETRDFGPRDDYHIPEPEDIRRLPTPGFREPQGPLAQERVDYRRELQRDEMIPMPERPPLRPAPIPAEPMPRPPRSTTEDSINDIMYRLDNIERRLARLEGAYTPQPRRY